MKYLYIIEKGKRNYSAYVPDLPGCVAAAKTKAETEKLIKEAIEFHIEGMLLDGEKIPKPTVNLGFVNINSPLKNIEKKRVFRKRKATI
jgi:predicted RNase H-like HicB family nuclease